MSADVDQSMAALRDMLDTGLAAWVRVHQEIKDSEETVISVSKELKALMSITATVLLKLDIDRQKENTTEEGS